jgi:phosphohistidine phosphatase
MLSRLPSLVALVRHANAVSTEEDPARPLSVAGRGQAEKMGGWLRSLGVEIEEIRHSGKARARQTAEIIADHVEVGPAAIREATGLAPNDDVGTVADELEAERRSLMLVGHLPFMARLASRLLTGDPGRLNLRFGEAGVVLLARAGGGWQLVAVLDQEMI